MSSTSTSTGTITQVIGSTFDAQFSLDSLPQIYNAVEVEINNAGEEIKLVGEVNKHLGGGRVRCVSLGSTDGLRRGQDCVNIGSPVTVPVGVGVLGRVFNLFGDPVDERGPVKYEKRMPKV